MTATILLVDDNEDETELFRLAAKAAGIGLPIHAVTNGEAALELLVTRRLEPILTLLDLKMPGIGGLETLRRIRSHAALKKLLVFVVSSSDLEEDKAAARGLGCEAYFVKPITFPGYVDMAARIKSLIPKGAS